MYKKKRENIRKRNEKTAKRFKCTVSPESLHTIKNLIRLPLLIWFSRVNRRFSHFWKVVNANLMGSIVVPVRKFHFAWFVGVTNAPNASPLPRLRFSLIQREMTSVSVSRQIRFPEMRSFDSRSIVKLFPCINWLCKWLSRPKIKLCSRECEKTTRGKTFFVQF